MAGGLSFANGFSLSSVRGGGAAAPGAPTANGALDHRYFTVGTGSQTFNIASGFSGSGLTYSVTSAPAGAVYSINAATGQMIVQTDDPTSGNVVVRATNGFGYVEQTFPLFVTEVVQYTVLAREPNGTVTVESLATPWTPSLTREADGTVTVLEAA